MQQLAGSCEQQRREHSLFRRSEFSDCTLRVVCCAAGDIDAAAGRGSPKGRPAKRSRAELGSAACTPQEVVCNDSGGASPADGAAGSGQQLQASGEAVLDELPVHAAVLIPASTWFRKRLLEPLGGDDPKVLRMHVWEGQLAAALAVVEAAYIGRLPDAAARDPGLLLQVLVVADSYGFEGCVAAAAAALAAALEPTPGPDAELPPHSARALRQPGMQASPGGAGGSGAAAAAAAAPHGAAGSVALATALALVELPETLLQQPALRLASTAAHQRVVAEYLDLEAAWQDPGLRELFSSLPLIIVAGILGARCLKVAREDTVLHALACWVAARAPGSLLIGDHDFLIEKIIIERLSPIYLACVVPQLPWFWECMARSPAFMHIMSAGHRACRGVRPGARQGGRPAARPPSALREVTLQADVAVEVIEAALQEGGNAGGIEVQSTQDATFFGGLFFAIKVVVVGCGGGAPDDDDDDGDKAAAGAASGARGVQRGTPQHEAGEPRDHLLIIRVEPLLRLPRRTAAHGGRWKSVSLAGTVTAVGSMVVGGSTWSNKAWNAQRGQRGQQAQPPQQPQHEVELLAFGVPGSPGCGAVPAAGPAGCVAQVRRFLQRHAVEGSDGTLVLRISAKLHCWTPLV